MGGRPRMLFVSLLSLALGLSSLVALFGSQMEHAHAQSPAFVRIIHASPFVGTADVFLDGSKLLSSFAFGAITGYAPVPPGPHKVQIALVGKGIGAAALTQTLAVQPGVAYTVAAIGATPTSLALEVFVDDNILAPGAAKLRVYHLSPNLGPLNVDSSGSTIVQGVTYQQASKYHSLHVGSYTFTVDASSTHTKIPISATLKANMVTSIFIVGMLNGNPKVELVPTQVSGLPGLPGTAGGDPNPIPTPSSQPLTLWNPWLIVALVMFALGICLLFVQGRRA
jgi:hypothetical protein